MWRWVMDNLEQLRHEGILGMISELSTLTDDELESLIQSTVVGIAQMDKEDIKSLLNLWYSEQIPPEHWIELLKENGDLRAEYNKERKRRENNGQYHK